MIKLNDRFIIKADAYQFILAEVKIVQEGKTKGEETHDILGYYSTVEGCLGYLSIYLIREKITEKDINLKEAIKEFKAIAEDIKKIAEGF